jgi:hypothetical protein
MNERIKLIAERAGVLADFGEDKKTGRYGIGGSYQSMEKFAELIVRDCACVCGAMGDSTDYEFEKDMAENCAMAIMKSFGVEE